MDALSGELISEWDVRSAPAYRIGPVPGGQRLVAHVQGGTARGRLSGEILPSGGDWPILRPNGVTTIDVRLLIRADEGEIIYVSYRGLLRMTAEGRERFHRGEPPLPHEHYLRTTPVFETGSERLAWLNGIVCVGVGQFKPGGIDYRIYAV